MHGNLAEWCLDWYGPEHKAPSIDRSEFTISATMAESGGYLAACQTRDGMIQLISSKNHYVFNLAWLSLSRRT